MAIYANQNAMLGKCLTASIENKIKIKLTRSKYNSI